MELLETLWLTSDDEQVIECTDQAKVRGAWKVGGGGIVSKSSLRMKGFRYSRNGHELCPQVLSERQGGII